MKINNFWDHRDVTYESGEIEEPLSLNEAKDYLRLEGFIDSDESPGESLSDMDFDDNLIIESIKAARELFEETCGISLVPKTMEAMISNGKGGQEILYGPVREITELLDCEGEEIDADYIKTVGIQWKKLMSPCYENMKITYEAGFTTIPAPIKLDMLRCVAYFYLNRGEEERSVFVSQLARRYSRIRGIA